jgi:hypothetical protein
VGRHCAKDSRELQADVHGRVPVRTSRPVKFVALLKIRRALQRAFRHCCCACKGLCGRAASRQGSK